MAEAFNRIHAAICVKVYGREDEISPAGRRKYQWHKYDCLRTMEVGEKIVRYADKREYDLFRTMASRIGKDYGAYFHLQYANGSLTIRRTI